MAHELDAIAGQWSEPQADTSAYIPAKEVVGDEYAGDYKDLHRILRDNPFIRTRKPSTQRLEVHAGDWNRYKRQRDKALDEPAIEPLIDAIQKRSAKERQSHFPPTSRSDA